MSFKKRVASLGFTLMELIIVLSILIALTAVAVPSIGAIRTNIEMLELDSTAREIFLSAQSSLTGLKASGALTPFQNGNDPNRKLLSYVSQDSELIEKLLPPDYAPRAGVNSVCIILHSTTASILKVYFTEEADFGTDAPEELTPAERKERRIGAYTGEDIGVPQSVSLKAPVLTVENDNELTVRFRYEKRPEDAFYTLQLTVTELDENGKPTGRKSTKSFFDQSTTGELTLDSLDFSAGGNNRFHNRSAFSEFTPGANLLITAELSASGAVTFNPSKAEKTVNSLFGDRKTVGGKEIVTVSCARHLQNLHPDYSGADLGSGYFEAVQGRDITWVETHDFISINNPKLNAYDGKGFSIRNLTGANGLFKSFNNGASASGAPKGKLTGIRLIDPFITVYRNPSDFRDNNFGILAGKVEYTAIEGCAVYADKRQADAGIGEGSSVTNCGGLVGYALQSEITDCFAALPRLNALSINIGGLAGQMDATAVRKSYAAVSALSVKGTGTTGVGMLIGAAMTYYGPNTVESCYATGKILQESNSHKTPYACGFAGGEISIARNCYCAIAYESPDTSFGPHYPFASCQTLSNCYYLNTAAPASDTVEKATAVSSEQLTKSGAVLTSLGEDFDFPTVMTFAYSAEHKQNVGGQIYSKSYPYPAIHQQNRMSTHYGDWVEQTVTDIFAFENSAADKDGNDARVKILFCPKGKSTVFYAQPMSGEIPAQGVGVTVKQSLKMSEDASALTVGTPVKDPKGRYKITVNGDRAASTGVYCVDITCSGVTLRVAVVVYDVSIQLKGEIKSTGERKINKTVGVTQTVQNTLKFNVDAEATFTADFENILPLAVNVKSGTAAIRNTEGMRNTKTTLDDFENIDGFIDENWETVKVMQNKVLNFGPGVSVNTNVTGNLIDYVLKPISGSDYFPHAGSKLVPSVTVKGQTPGAATVSACWGANPATNVNFPITVSGKRVAIKKVSATVGTAPAAVFDNYPYLVTLSAKKDDVIRLDLTSNMTNGTFAWTVTGGGLSAPITSAEMTPKSIEIRDTETANALYRVHLLHKSKEGKSSADFLYIFVKRDMTKDKTHDITFDSKGDSFRVFTVSGKNHVYLEQVEGYNKQTVFTDPNDSDVIVKWHLGANKNAPDYFEFTQENPSSTITRRVGEVDNVPVSLVTWDYANGAHSSTGEINIEAFDFSYNGDSPITFSIYATAFSLDNPSEEGIGTKEIVVHIMPKLRLAPQNRASNTTDTVKMTTNRQKNDNRNITFSATMQKKGENPSSIFNNKTEESFNGLSAGTYTIEVKCGPYSQTATLEITAHELAGGDLEGSVNYDTKLDGKETVFIQKGYEHFIQFAWVIENGYTSRYQYQTILKNEHIENPVGLDASIARLKEHIPEDLSGIDNSKNYGSLDSYLTGMKFGKTSIGWNVEAKAKGLFSKNPKITFSYDIHVIGVELDKTAFTLTKDAAHETPTQTITLRGYYPTSMSNRNIKLTANENVELRINSSTPRSGVTKNGNELIIPLNSSDGANFEVKVDVIGKDGGVSKIEAVYHAENDGKSFESKANCVVNIIEEHAEDDPVIEICKESDRATLSQLFGNLFDKGELGPLATYFMKDGNLAPLLYSKETLGYNTLYLKAYVKDASGNPINPYDGDFAASWAAQGKLVPGNLSAVMFESRTKDNVVYIKITVRPTVTELIDFKFQAKFLSKVAEIQIFACEMPEVTLYIGGVNVTNTRVLEPAVQNYTLDAVLYPLLCDENGTPLDSLTWSPEFPSDDLAEAGCVVFETDQDGYRATFKIAYDPGFKIAVWVQSSLVASQSSARTAEAAAVYALIFQKTNE